MLEPLDRFRSASTLFQLITKRLRGFVHPKHVLLQIDTQFDFAKLVAPLESKYYPPRRRGFQPFHILSTSSSASDVRASTESSFVRVYLPLTKIYADST